jgi:hypothetical protein
MSATAFQRMRREQAAKSSVEEKEEQPKTLSEFTVKELKSLLDEKGIEYDARANKATLIGLLEQKEKEPEDGNDPEADPDNDDDEGAE